MTGYSWTVTGVPSPREEHHPTILLRTWIPLAGRPLQSTYRWKRLYRCIASSYAVQVNTCLADHHRKCIGLRRIISYLYYGIGYVKLYLACLSRGNDYFRDRNYDHSVLGTLLAPRLLM